MPSLGLDFQKHDSDGGSVGIKLEPFAIANYIWALFAYVKKKTRFFLPGILCSIAMNWKSETNFGDMRNDNGFGSSLRKISGMLANH